jgi:hypothetical protein
MQVHSGSLRPFVRRERNDALAVARQVKSPEKPTRIGRLPDLLVRPCKAESINCDGSAWLRFRSWR